MPRQNDTTAAILLDWAKLPRTSPIVPWNGLTIVETKRLNTALKAQAADRSRFVDLVGYVADLELKWDAK